MTIGQVYITPMNIYVVARDSNSIYLFALNRQGSLLWHKQIASYSEKLVDYTLPVVSPNGKYLAWTLKALLQDTSQNVHVVTTGTYLIRFDGEITALSGDTGVSGVTDAGEVISNGGVFGEENTIYQLNRDVITFKDSQGRVLNEYSINGLMDITKRLILPLGDYLMVVTYDVDKLFVGITGNVLVSINQTPVTSEVYLFDQNGNLLDHSTVVGIVSTAAIDGDTLVLAAPYSPEMENTSLNGEGGQSQWIRATGTKLYFMDLETKSLTEMGIASLLLPWTSGLLYSKKLDIVVGGFGSDLMIFKPSERKFRTISLNGEVKAVKNGMMAVVSNDSLYVYTTQDFGMSVLNIYSQPDSAEVYVDGTYQGVTPISLKLLPGMHSIRLKKDDYEEYTTSITLNPGDSKTISVTLTPKFGYLMVYSTPTNAEVYVDGDYVGKTPLKGYKLSTGTHTIKLVRDGYEDYVKTVNINPGETTKIEATLSEAKAMLKITSDPSGAGVYVDGDYKGTTPLTISLSPGTHSVRLSKSDYEDYTTSVTLNPGESKTISATLTPTFGYLSIDSTPQGAKVYIDDSYVGDTPLTDYKLSTGEHTVKVVKNGYEEFTKTVTVNPGAEASVTASLVAIITTTSSSSAASTTTTSSPTQTAQAITGGIPTTYIIAGLLVLGIIGGVSTKAMRGKPKPSGDTAKPAPTPTKKPVPGFPPELLSKYEPLEFLGEGGFAKVFKVKRKSDGKIIALKVPNLDEKARKFFLKEVKAWRLLDHPNIVKLYNAFDEPLPHLEIEFVDGVKLDGKIIRDLGKYPKPVGEEKALNLIRGIAEGLKHAHSKQVYHRDLKPQNVLITSDLTPKITDWGLAKVGAVSTTATTTKGLTLLYAAPEQLDEEVYGHTDHRTDIYQLGLIFYELLTGKLPYQGTSPAVVMAKVINPEVKPKPPSHFDKALAKYDGIFERLLAKRKEDRYQNIDEFLKDLGLMKKLDEERKALEETVEKTKTTMSLTTDSKELRKLRRQVVEQLTRLALLHAQLNDKAELINALEDLKAFSKEHRGEIENAIGQFELMMRESVPVSKSTLDELKVLLHKVEREVEG